jgi:hypothetical protein
VLLFLLRAYTLIQEWLYSPLLGSDCFFSFVILYTVDRTPWRGDQPVARALPMHRTTKTQNNHTQTYMPRVGFELMIPVFERPKTFYVLDSAATVIGMHTSICIKVKIKVKLSL